MALTQEQFDLLKNRLSTKQSGVSLGSTPTTSTVTKPQESSYLSKVGEQYKKAGENIAEGIKTGAEQYQEGVKKMDESSSFVDKLKGLGQATVGVARSGLRTAGNVATAAFAPITTAAEPIIKPAIEKALEVPQVRQAFDAANALAQKNPEMAKDIQNIFDLATLGVGGAIEKPIAEAALKTAGAGTELAGKAVSSAGTIAKSAGRELAESAITPTKAEAEKILTYEAKNTLKDRIKSAVKGEIIEEKPITRGTTAFEKGIMGTERGIGVQAKRETSKLWNNTIAPALEKSKDVITKNELFAPIEARIAKTTDPILKESYEDAFNAIKTAYSKNKQWSLKDAQFLKEDLARFIPEKVYQGKPIANELKTFNADMADAIRTKIYSSLKDEGIKKSYIDYGNLKKLEDLGVKAISESTGKGGFGNFWTGLYEAATTPIKTIGGQVLYRVGNKIEFLGEKGIKNFGQFLKSKGYSVKK